MNTHVSQSTTQPAAARNQTSSPVLYAAVIVTLVVSLLPNIIWQETSGSTPSWLLWAKLAVLAILVVGGTFWNVLRPLRSYFAVLVALYLAEWASGLVGQTALWKSWFGATPFTTNMFGNQVLRLLVALIMIAVLFAIKRKRSSFFLVKGQTDAPVEPIRWLGINGPIRWTRFGAYAALCISLGTLAFLVMAGAPSGDTLIKALPMLPMIILFALMNSFSEELNYRAAFLSTLNGVVSNQQAIMITAAFFGLGHFYGVPYGIIGVLMAGFLGWLLGKAMLETRGFFWPWVIHFFQDVLIFSFMAIGSVVAGGK